jgi:DNA polymerase-3 subunit delta'
MIEEPPEKTLFLLVSDDPDKVIPTILSRCQLIRIPVFKAEEIQNYLMENFSCGDVRAGEIAGISNGNIIRAGELFENEELSSVNLDYFRNLMRFAWKRDVQSLLTWSEELASTGREAQKNFLVFALRILRENLMLTLGQKDNNLVFLAGEEASFSGNFHPFINQDNIYPLTEELNLAHAHIEANGNARIIFLDLALKVTRLIR